MNKKFFFFIIILLSTFSFGQNQNTQQKFIQKIYKVALNDGKSYNWLDHLSNQIGGRLSGSLNAERAIQWSREELNLLKIDNVYLQPVMVPKWVRGTFEYARIITGPGKTMNVPICALGGSIATPNLGIEAEVVEVKNFDELKKIGKKQINGKIVFFNRKMPDTIINPLEAYKKTVDQRTKGASIASKYGAVGVIVRSMNFRLDDFPHTGSTYYGNISNKDRIPAAAISTNGAELLSSMLSINPKTTFYFKQNCKNYPEVLSHNVIGEIKGSEFPNEIILVGGHLDSWDLGDGSHDDGAGVVQSMEVLNIFKKLNYIPKRTIRVVLFMNEENGLKGGKHYAKLAKLNNENHVFALESDLGGFTPRGFSFETSKKKFLKLKNWEKFFKPYLSDNFIFGTSAPDIGPLKSDNVVLVGLRPDLQRYFEYHHSAIDRFDAINKRELELGAAAMTSLVYLVDQFGIQD